MYNEVKCANGIDATKSLSSLIIAHLLLQWKTFAMISIQSFPYTDNAGSTPARSYRGDDGEN
jgi:hypothetical protein